MTNGIENIYRSEALTDKFWDWTTNKKSIFSTKLHSDHRYVLDSSYDNCCQHCWDKKSNSNVLFILSPASSIALQKT